MKQFLAVQAGKPETKAVFQASNRDEARVLAMRQGFVIVEEV